VGVRKSSRISGAKPREIQMHSRLWYELSEGLMDILAFLVGKLWQK